MPAELHLLRPLWLLTLLPFAGLLWLWWRRRGSGGDWQRICDPALLPHLLIRGAAAAPRWPLLLIGLGGGLGILALAGPVWHKVDQPVFRETSALVIALDLSRSMDSPDLAPSRLVRARLKLLDILERRREGQTALLVFADQAFAVTPLTDDTDTIASLAGALETGLMPGQGSSPDQALEKARELLSQAGARQGHVLLITDSPGDERTTQVIARLRDEGHRLHLLGVGTPEGAPIPVAGGGFLKDAKGAIVIPTLDEPALKHLAQVGGGRYARLSVDNQDLNYLLQAIDARPIEQQAERTDLRVDRWREEGPWLLLLLLPLAALAFRRGYLGLAVMLLLPVPDPAQALDWQGLWQRPDQQAVALLQAGQAAAAAERFADPGWKAAAHYRAGDYEQTVAALDGLQDPESLYNKGNALARAGRLEEALEAYDRALAQAPGHADATYNRKLVEEALKQQQQQQQSQQGEQNQDSEQNQDQSEAQDGDSEQGQQDQQQQDGQQQQPQQAGSNRQEDSAQQEDAESQSDQPADEAKNQDQQAQSAAEPQDGGEQPQQPEPQAGDDQEQQARETSTAQPSEASESDPETAETDQATRQWLRRIPDDPGGLLRRKFKYQYRQLAAPRPESETW